MATCHELRLPANARINEHSADAILANYDIDPAIKQTEALDQLAVAGQNLMAERHGTVYPVFRRGKRGHLGYNNGDHTRNFAADTTKLGEALGHSALQIATDKVVAAWHDSDQTAVIRGLPRLGDDERISAEELLRAMRREKIDKSLAEAAVYGILGTWPVIGEASTPIGQWATLFDAYPTKEAKRAAYMAATCDLSRLYSPRSPLVSDYLYTQRQDLAPDEVPPLDGLEKYLVGQIGFLSDHQYPIAEANRLFTELKPEVITHTVKKLEFVQANKEPSKDNEPWLWNKIIEMDNAFARRHKRQTTE